MTVRNFSGSLEPKFNPFAEDYLAEILEATAAAWARMKHPERNEIEDRITFRLAGHLINDPRFAELPYDVAPQHWLVGPNGERLGRLDLYFKHRNSQRDYFAFEAKRLHVTYPGGSYSTEYSTYVGNEGMQAFVDGYYSKGFSACGMLGYVMDSKSDEAWVGLGKIIESRRTPLKLIGSCKLEMSALSRVVAKGITGTHLGETEHDLNSYRLRLFHLVLPVKSTH